MNKDNKCPFCPKIVKKTKWYFDNGYIVVCKDLNNKDHKYPE